MSMRPPLLLPFDTMPTVGAAQEAARAPGVYAKGKNKGKGNAVYAKGKNKGKGFQERIDGAGTLRPRGTVGQGKGERELNESLGRLRESVGRLRE